MKPSFECMIPLAPITKKNSQRIFLNGANGRPFIAPSKAFKVYEAAALSYLDPPPRKPIDYPVNVRCVFGMPNRRKTDLTNLLEAIDDILVKGGVLADDNYQIVAGHDGSRCTLAKAQPYTHIRITPMSDEAADPDTEHKMILAALKCDAFRCGIDPEPDWFAEALEQKRAHPSHSMKNAIMVQCMEATWDRAYLGDYILRGEKGWLYTEPAHRLKEYIEKGLV